MTLVKQYVLSHSSHAGCNAQLTSLGTCYPNPTCFYYSMTTMTDAQLIEQLDAPVYHVIFEAEPGYTDAAFTVEELKDIVDHGMSAGVPMFIYTKDNVAWFDENSDTIEEYLSDWYQENMGEADYIGAIAGADNGHTYAVSSIQELKTRMVWAYVELKAYEILTQVDPDY